MFTEKQLNARSQSIAKASGKIALAMHNHMVDIAEFIKSTGNVTPATTFVSLVSSATRKNAIRQWFSSFGGCSWNNEKKAFGKRKDFTWDIVAAKATPFYDLIPEPEFKPVNGYALLKAAAKQMEKALKDTANAGKHKVDEKMLASLKELLKNPAEPVDKTEKLEVKKPEVQDA